MTKAVITAFHKYQPYGGEYYAPILDFYLDNMRKNWRGDVDEVYLLDSTWGIPEGKDYKVIKVDPSLRYYDAYRWALPFIKEEAVLFLDNDMVIYKPGVVGYIFSMLDGGFPDFDVVSIYDTCGTYTTYKLNGANKFCPYLFATSTDYLRMFANLDWGPHMPESETLGALTAEMLLRGAHPYEMQEDKSNICFDGTKDGRKSKDLGYYHIRAGSVPALLLAYKYNDPDKYWDYLKTQPKNEYLRQMAWYWFMATETGNMAMGRELISILADLEITPAQWTDYTTKFIEYHGI